MTAAAAATRSLRVGSGICLIIERDPIVTAKEVASIDHLSGGRVDFGVGAGWNREEMANHGTDPKRRFGLMRERVEAMKAIWTEDEASYHGEQVDFERIWSWPKPAQHPHPPVMIGGNGPKVIDRVLRYGDAWMPQHRHGNAIERIAELQRRAAEAGRGHVPVVVFGVPAKAEVLAEYEQAGADRAVHWLPAGAARPGRAGARALRGRRRASCGGPRGERRRVRPRHAGRARVRRGRAGDDRRVRARRRRRATRSARASPRCSPTPAGSRSATRRATRRAGWAAASASGCCSAPATAR